MAGWNSNTPITDSIGIKTRTHVGLGHTPSYQASGVPFIHTSDSGYDIDLEFVTRAITVTSTGEGNTISFGNTNDAEFILSQGTTRFEIKCKAISVAVNNGDVSICAELTGIAASQCPVFDQDDLGSEAGGE